MSSAPSRSRSITGIFGNAWNKGTKMCLMSDVDLSSILCTEDNHTPNHFVLRKPGISGGLIVPLPSIGINLPLSLKT